DRLRSVLAQKPKILRQTLSDLESEETEWVGSTQGAELERCHEVTGSEHGGQDPAQQGNQDPFGTRLGLGHLGLVQHFDGRQFFGLFNLRQFVLLGKDLKNGLLSLYPAVQIVISNT